MRKRRRGGREEVVGDIRVTGGQRRNVEKERKKERAMSRGRKCTRRR